MALTQRGLRGGVGFLQLTLHFERARRQLVILGLQQPVVETAIMLNRAQAVGRNAQLDAAIQLFTQQRNVLQVRQEHALGFVVSVADIVAHLATFAGQFANTRHDISRFVHGCGPHDHFGGPEIRPEITMFPGSGADSRRLANRQAKLRG